MNEQKKNEITLQPGGFFFGRVTNVSGAALTVRFKREQEDHPRGKVGYTFWPQSGEPRPAGKDGITLEPNKDICFSPEAELRFQIPYSITNEQNEPKCRIAEFTVTNLELFVSQMFLRCGEKASFDRYVVELILVYGYNCGPTGLLGLLHPILNEAGDKEAVNKVVRQYGLECSRIA